VPDPAGGPGAAPDHVDAADHPLRINGGGGVERVRDTFVSSRRGLGAHALGRRRMTCERARRAQAIRGQRGSQGTDCPRAACGLWSTGRLPMFRTLRSPPHLACCAQTTDRCRPWPHLRGPQGWQNKHGPGRGGVERLPLSFCRYVSPAGGNWMPWRGAAGGGVGKLRVGRYF
jgi:hypothetical protein